MNADQRTYKKTIVCDVDDVCLSLVPSFLSTYNRKFNDNLKIENITDWDISQFLKPEAKDFAKETFSKSRVFRKASPVDGAIEGVNLIRSLDWRILFVTANNPDNVKFEWLKEHNFIDDIEDFVVAKDKSVINAYGIIDDNFKNVCNFNGWRILFSRPWNQKYTENDMRQRMGRVDGWKQIMEVLGGNS